MTPKLDHLPSGKRRELAHVVEILTESFAAAVATRRAPRLKDGRLLKIILFGSYARGDWVDDPTGRYFSDFDLLVVVSHADLADDEFWTGAVQRILADTASGERLSTPVNFIVHSLDDVNDKLRLGRSFFVDILKDGIILRDAPEARFEAPGRLPPATALAEAQGYFDEWFDSAQYAQTLASYSIRDGQPKYAAFLLHQAAERLYHCVLLVITLYSPKSHNLVFLRTQCERLDSRLAAAWPHERKFQRRCFELLRAAYVKARYSRHYKITDDELTWLTAQIIELQALVRGACEERLGLLRAASDGDEPRPEPSLL